MSGEFEKAITKMEKQIVDKPSGLVLISHGLSIRVDSMKGPISEGELPKCREFGVSIARGLQA